MPSLSQLKVRNFIYSVDTSKSFYSDWVSRKTHGNYAYLFFSLSSQVNKGFSNLCESSGVAKEVKLRVTVSQSYLGYNCSISITNPRGHVLRYCINLDSFLRDDLCEE